MPSFPLPRSVIQIFFNYTIFGNTLERVDHDYLWISISHDLCWENHCNNIIKNASKTLGLLHSNLSPCSKEVKSMAYQAIVRQQLEYTAEAWNPYNITTADSLEHIQHAAARFVGGGVDPIPCVSTHRISDPRSGPAQLLPPHVKQRSYPHGVRPQIPDR